MPEMKLFEYKQRIKVSQALLPGLQQANFSTKTEVRVGYTIAAKKAIWATQSTYAQISLIVEIVGVRYHCNTSLI